MGGWRSGPGLAPSSVCSDPRTAQGRAGSSSSSSSSLPPPHPPHFPVNVNRINVLVLFDLLKGGDGELQQPPHSHSVPYPSPSTISVSVSSMNLYLNRFPNHEIYCLPFLLIFHSSFAFPGFMGHIFSFFFSLVCFSI